MSCTFCGKKFTMVHIVGLLGAFIGVILLSYVSYALNTEEHLNEAKLKSIEEAPASLVMVSLIFRHGDRTPTGSYTTDPHKDYAWPGGKGVLTQKGIQQMYRLGQNLHARYKSIIPNEMYTRSKITAESSEADRCLMSAEAFLGGFLPPPPDWVLPIKWQPVPVNYRTRLEDYLLAQKKPCAQYDLELKETFDNDSKHEFQDVKNEMFYNFLSEKTGDHYTSKSQVELLFNVLQIQEAYGLALPAWTKEVYPDEMLLRAKQNLALLTRTSYMARIKGGYLVKEIVNSMQSKLKGSNHVVSLYSGHDVTLVNFLRVIGYEELMKPEYGAAIAVELHTVPDEIATQITILYFNNSETIVPTKIPVPSCDGTCSLSGLIYYLDEVAEVLPSDDWDNECKIK